MHPLFVMYIIISYLSLRECSIIYCLVSLVHSWPVNTVLHAYTSVRHAVPIVSIRCVRTIPVTLQSIRCVRRIPRSQVTLRFTSIVFGGSPVHVILLFISGVFRGSQVTLLADNNHGRYFGHTVEPLYITDTFEEKCLGLYTEVAFVERLFCTQTVHLGPGRYI